MAWEIAGLAIGTGLMCTHESPPWRFVGALIMIIAASRLIGQV